MLEFADFRDFRLIMGCRSKHARAARWQQRRINCSNGAADLCNKARWLYESYESLLKFKRFTAYLTCDVYEVFKTSEFPLSKTQTFTKCMRKTASKGNITTS